MGSDYGPSAAPPTPPESVAFVVRAWLRGLWFRTRHGFVCLNRVVSWHHRLHGGRGRMREVSLTCLGCDATEYLR